MLGTKSRWDDYWGPTGNTAPNDTKENDITLLLEIVDQFCKKIQRALKKRFFTVQFRVYEEELLSAHII